MWVPSAGGAPQPVTPTGATEASSFAASPARRRAVLYREREPLQLGGCGHWRRLCPDRTNQDRTAWRLPRPLRAVSLWRRSLDLRARRTLFAVPLILTGWQPLATRSLSGRCCRQLRGRGRPVRWVNERVVRVCERKFSGSSSYPIVLMDGSGKTTPLLSKPGTTALLAFRQTASA